MIPVFSPLAGLAGMVRSLFSAGEQGVWYDPSDLSTLYQDAYGTTPVTAVGQPVGLMMDARKKEIFKITKADLLDPAKWRGYNGPTASQQPDGSIRITRNTTIKHATLSPMSGAYTLPPGYALRVKISLKATADTFQFMGEPYVGWRNVNGDFLNSWSIPAGTVFNKNTVAINLTNTSIVSSFTASPNLLGFYMWRTEIDSYNSSDYIDVLDFEITAYYPPARQTTTASRPTLQQESGKYYLSFDGVDDYLSTGSIDFTGTDKMTVLAGVRKLSDAASGIVAELSSNVGGNSQSFAVFAPGSNGANHLRWVPEAGRDINSPNQYPAPISAVLAGVGEKAGIGEFRVNGVSVGVRTVQTAGNYGNYPLYIGRRGGTILPFNGRLYGLIVRGAQTDDLHLTNAEKYLANKSGVTL